MYLAHKNGDREQSIMEHLYQTAQKSSEFAKSFGFSETAHLVGLLHDIGKYSDAFQRRILGCNERVDHSSAGAKELIEMDKNFGLLYAYCIAGHHTGLPNGGSSADIGNEGTLWARKIKRVEKYEAFKNDIDINSFGDINEIKKMKFDENRKNIGFQLFLLIKMLYSCLVDADFLDTQEFMTDNAVDRSVEFKIDKLNLKLQEKIKTFENADNKINIKRNEILSECLEKSSCGKGMFSLTVPTGGGKTISSLAFALNHATKNNMDRVIYVIPYTSIIEQNASVFKNILGDDVVLEHHSNFDYKDEEIDVELASKLQLASENWDIPVIVTTNVQFFESVFSNKSSKCRKLHNITNSVIIFDEVQMLPSDYLLPCVLSMTELVKNYNSTVVMCSATQPDIQNFIKKYSGSSEIEITEIASNIEGLFEFFKRTQITDIGHKDNLELAELINKNNQALCIVNTKKHALELFELVSGDNVYHLSTLMAPVHRRKVIEDIKNKLKNKEKCVVISTQLIEAGVDIDFPVVYRSMAGLDSIIQSAGRCNREGKLDVGRVYVFEPEDNYKKHQPSDIKNKAKITQGVIRRHENISMPNAIKEYFNEIYYTQGKSGLDVKDIVSRINKGSTDFSFNFKDISDDFKLIDNNMHPVVVRYCRNEDDERIEQLLNKLQTGESYRNTLRSLQQYTVNLYENDYKKLVGAGGVEYINEIAVLRDSSLYNEETGLKIPDEEGNGIYI